ncbi:MAG: hypothetical protein ACREX3_13605 [Gammaproteobacteria bacterium]
MKSHSVTNLLLIAILFLLGTLIWQTSHRPMTAYDLVSTENRGKLSEEVRNRLKATYLVRVTNTVDVEGQVDVGSVYDTVTVEF